MSEDPIRNAARATRRRHKVPPGTGCPFCGLKDPDYLIEVGRSLFDEHHVFGVTNLPDTVWLCPTCHRRVHIGLQDAGVDLSHTAERIVLEVICVVLVASAVVFRMLANTYEWLAQNLQEFIAALDKAHPTWRAMPEAVL